jgi:hypothetical protein
LSHLKQKNGDIMGLSHRTIETKVYKFDQLSETAQAYALQKHYDYNTDHGWWEAVYDDAVNMATELGIDIDCRRGSSQPCIFFSGFSSQGDGACFEGSYSYKKGALKALKSAAPARYKDQETKKWVDLPNNAELHRIAKELTAVQRKHFYRLEAKVVQSGHYNHSGCTRIEVNDCESLYRDIGDAEDDIKQLLRDFMDWIYKRLEDEYDWLTSDEQIKEALEANEVEFDEDGGRV